MGKTPSLSLDALENRKLDQYEFQSISVKTPRDQKPQIVDKLDTDMSQRLGSIDQDDENKESQAALIEG